MPRAKKNNGQPIDFFQITREDLQISRTGLTVSLPDDTDEVDFCAYLRSLLEPNQFGLAIPNGSSVLITVHDGVDNFLDALRNMEVQVIFWHARGF